MICLRMVPLLADFCSFCLHVLGIPWHENYYGKYAHKYGAPDHDIRYSIRIYLARSVLHLVPQDTQVLIPLLDTWFLDL